MQGMNSLTNLNFFQFNCGPNPAYYNCSNDLNYSSEGLVAPLQCMSCDQHETSLRNLQAQYQDLLAEN